MLSAVARAVAGVAACFALVAGAWTIVQPSTARADGGCPPGQVAHKLPGMDVITCTVVTVITSPAPPTSSGGDEGGGEPTPCLWNGAPVLCKFPDDPGFWWDNHAQCWIGPALDMTPPYPKDGWWEYWLDCPQPDWTPGSDHIGITTILLQHPPFGQPDPTKLAMQAEAQLVLRAPKITMAPTNNGSGLVGMPVWLAIASDSNQYWGQQTTPPITVPGLSLTATAKAKSVTWDMGDGHTVPCLSPGTAYSASDGMTSSPDCPYTYTQPSGSKPGGVYTVTASTTWEVTWSASTGQSGTLPDQTLTSTTTIKIGELQAVN